MAKVFNIGVELITGLITLVCALIIIAFFTLAERKVIASVQRRRGPNVVGIFGLLQAIADGLKLVGKEILIPSKANTDLFILAPVLTFGTSLINWAFLPIGNIGNIIANQNLAILFVLAVSSIGVYGIILSGWASNSRYAFLGAVRSTSQMVSYEVSMGLLIMPVIICTGSFNFSTISYFQSQNSWLMFALLPVAGLFLISILAETNRTPFDLPEAEAELVAGYNVEYSSLTFALFFLGEYGNMIILAIFTSLLFFGGWPLGLPSWLSLIIFIAKIMAVCFFFIFVRANLPRYRYDQLMAVGWEVILPISLGYLILVASFVRLANGEPMSQELPYVGSIKI
jgi:NADH-quinone oxidoreductase subunit H